MNSNDSVLLSTEVTVGTSGRYAFQVGTDWGRGGAAALVDSHTGAIVSERGITDDVWWGYNWNHGDVFTTEFEFVAGNA